MNERENRMVEILSDLKAKHNVFGVKAEFEAEGTRLEEALRLKEIVTRAGLDLTIKIGGCEALKDMYDARSIGVDKIVAPMIESEYALKKYLLSVEKAFPEWERKHMKFLINIETRQGVENFDRMLDSDFIEVLDGIVIGRVDMTGSLNLSRESINSDEIFKIAEELVVKAKGKNLICAIGGGVAKESIPFFSKLPAGSLDYFETRKVLFKWSDEKIDDYAKGILKAVGFELMWLKNKRDFYGGIFKEDDERLVMLESRYKNLIKEAGGFIS